MTYLNHAGTSWPKPDGVLEAADEAARSHPTTWPARFQHASEAVAAAFHVESDELLFTPGCTCALSLAVADVPWQPGDRVITSSMEHHALIRPLEKLSNVEVVRVPRGPAGPLDLSVAEQELERGARLVAVSMAASVTGELLPYRELVELAHRHGAWVLLDAAQVAGWVDLDLTALNVDLLAFAGHKGPQAPTGVGGLYVRPGLFLDTPGASCSIDACRPRPGWCDAGSVSLPGLVGLAEGLRWMRANEPLARARTCAEQFERAFGRRSLGAGEKMPTRAFDVRVSPSNDVVSQGFQCAPEAHRALGTHETGVLRVSFGPESTLEEARAAGLRLANEISAVG